MTWRDRQTAKASFRGVEFSVDTHELETGRRVHVHEYPLRDLPAAEDMGRSTRRFTVEALLLGADYDLQRDKLLAAAEARGPGKLVHPYLGEMQVSCVGIRLRERTQEGGVARMSLTFVEDGGARFPGNEASSGAAVYTAAASASTAAQLSCAKRHSVAGKPAFVAAASASIFSRALDSISGAVGLVRGAAVEVAALGRDVQTARDDLTTLIYAPASAAQALVSNIQQLVRNVATAPRDAWQLARTMYRFGSDLLPVAPTTASRAAQATNQAELVQLVRVAALSEGARAAAQVQWDSYDEAVAARDEIADALDDLMLQASTDALFDAMRVLRAATVRDAQVRGGNLARLVQYRPGVTMPAQLAAQLVYADGSRSDEMLARNPAIRHPLFVPGARPLEVLVDG